ncbi:MAG TPA: response regulator, partial [Anaeromyxobacteraceae bacterium]|nr:response regulator [Anaeromyxobacteraceae bacterium]
MSPPAAPHLLLVEDNEATRYAVVRVLRGAGYRVSAAETGERGVAMTRELRPDLVLLDVKLPDMMGFEVAAQLRSDPATAGIPIVHLSATHISTADQIRGLEGGADAYLTHPIEPHVLVATLDALLRVRMAEARYRRLFTTGILGIVHWTLDGEILDANDEFLRIAGRDRRELAGPLRFSDLTPEEARAEDAAVLAELRATGVGRTVERELLRADGSRVPVAVGAALLQGREGEAVAFVADLTARRAAERERDQALASARDALARAESAQRRMALLLGISGALMREPTDPRAALRELTAALVPEVC